MVITHIAGGPGPLPNGQSPTRIAPWTGPPEPAQAPRAPFRDPARTASARRRSTSTPTTRRISASSRTALAHPRARTRWKSHSTTITSNATMRRCGPAPPPTDNAACECSLNRYYGSCGGLETRKEANWCTEPGWDTSIWEYSEFCCAASSGDCCESDDGAVTGLVIGIFAGITLCCVACCYCCKCCCWAPKATTVVHAHPGVVVAGQPGVVLQGQPVYTTTATVLPK